MSSPLRQSAIYNAAAPQIRVFGAAPSRIQSETILCMHGQEAASESAPAASEGGGVHVGSPLPSVSMSENNTEVRPAYCAHRRGFQNKIN